MDDLLRDNGPANANPTRTPIVYDCYDVKADDAELLEMASAPTGPTLREFQSLVGSLI